MKELQSAEPCMKIYEELRDILVALGLGIVKNKEHDGIWNLQRCDKRLRTGERKKKDKPPEGPETDMVSPEFSIKIGNDNVPMNEVKWFEEVERLTESEAILKATNRQVFERKTLINLNVPEDWAEEEIGFKQGLLDRAEGLLGKEILELVLSPENRSTRKAYEINQMLDILRHETATVGMVLINMLQLEALWHYELNTQQMAELISLAQAKDVQILLATTDLKFGQTLSDILCL